MSYRAMAKVSEAQEQRTAKAIMTAGDLQWVKTSLGWTCHTPSGGSYLVTERACSCPDHQRRCAGTEIRCKHRVALAMKLAEEALRQPAIVAGPPARRPLPDEEQDAIFDRIFGAG